MGSTLEHSLKESVDICYATDELLLTHLGSLKRLLVELSPNEISVILYQASVFPPTRLLKERSNDICKEMFFEFHEDKSVFHVLYSTGKHFNYLPVRISYE